MKTITSLQRYACYATLVGLAAATIDYAHGALANGNLNTASLSSQIEATPTSWTVAATRGGSNFNDAAASQGFANADVPDPGGLGLFYKPFQGNPTFGDVSAHLYQDTPGTPTIQYTLTGWARAEPNYSGLIPASRTKSEFAIEFLNVGNAVIGGATNDLRTAGLGNTYAQYTLMAIAPVGTVNVRARSSMIDAFNNPAGGQQAFFVDVFALVPEPSTFVLLGLGLVGLVGIRRLRRRS